jgi:hypothetical protein
MTESTRHRTPISVRLNPKKLSRTNCLLLLIILSSFAPLKRPKVVLWWCIQ